MVRITRRSFAPTASTSTCTRHGCATSFNDSKAVAISLGATEQAARAAGRPAEMPWATAELPDGTHAQGGIVLYGPPIGDDIFVRACLAAAPAVDEAKAGLKSGSATSSPISTS